MSTHAYAFVDGQEMVLAVQVDDGNPERLIDLLQEMEGTKGRIERITMEHARLAFGEKFGSWEP